MPRGMLSLLAGLGTGYNQGTQQQVDNDRKAKLDQIALDRAAREGTEFDQAQADRSAFRAAGAPVVAAPDTVVDADGNTVQRVVKPDTMDNADVGQPGEAPVTTPAMRVGSQGMLTPMQAQGALAAANTPEAVRKRQLSVLSQQNPAAASQLQAADLRAQADTMELGQKKFDSQLSDAAKGGWESLGKFMDDSASSPTKGKWIPSADGKTMVAYKQDPTTGSLTPTGTTFDNSAKGLADAAEFYSQAVPITAKVAHFQAQQAENRQEAHNNATEDYQRGMLGVAQQNANTNEGYRRDMGAAAVAKAANTGGGARGAQFSDKEWEGIYSKSDPSITGWDAVDGGKPQQDGNLLTLRRQLLGEARSSGAAGPSEAGAAVDEVVMGLKQRAQAISDASQKSDKRVTPQQALQQLMATLKAPPARPSASASPVTAPAPTTPRTVMQDTVRAVAPPAPAAPADERVPDPPPQTRQIGLSNAPNPAFADWEASYGVAYRAQKAAQATADEQAAQKARGYNPYLQPKAL